VIPKLIRLILIYSIHTSQRNFFPHLSQCSIDLNITYYTINNLKHGAVLVTSRSTWGP